MEGHNIYLIGGEDDEAAEFIQSEKEDRCSLVCTYRGKRIEASADDFFEALCALRRQLQTDGLIPFCYGASLNVFPSAMSRQMSSGLSAYRLTLGKQALRADLVQIFAQGHDVIPASVEHQQQFFDDWLKSL